MHIGMIGLGKMGMNMVKRLLEGGHTITAFDLNPDHVQESTENGAVGVASIHALIENLTPPRVIWMMLPAGDPVKLTIDLLAKQLARDDLVVDGGNSRYLDDYQHADALKSRGIRFLDAGVSGGIWGLTEGYCIMVGGAKKDFHHIEPLLESLCAPEGYLYCGPTGAGHFVKMVHNGIEYGMMEAYGEGYELLQSSPYGEHLDLAAVANLWNHGSVIRSWLLELIQSAFENDPDLSDIQGVVEDSGEGRWTVEYAIEAGVPVPVITESLFRRFNSRQANAFSNRVLAAMRREFGGHAVITHESDD